MDSCPVSFATTKAFVVATYAQRDNGATFCSTTALPLLSSLGSHFSDRLRQIRKCKSDVPFALPYRITINLHRARNRISQ